ncbi:hypothetical protein [Peredibacter starrii]|uniref:Lipoprotein n=1 Tax=Peredibacter starrii TaxID=28202 RepID=A0AAX4HJW2_9BACT|nr:hypothetical protein [Peredibacter starrii]WPU63484.1 hypothetical protein SOO65_12370 [Peredibacter starrii]
MRTLRKISPITFMALSLAAFSGCKEFYDSEFTEAALSQNNEDDDRFFEANLVATDANFPNLTGKGTFDFKDGVVNVNISLDDIPQNFTQVFYTYSSADCSSLQTTFAADTTSSRNFTHSETLTADALSQELIAAGASQGSDDADLANTSLLIRAAPIANGLPSPSGTNVITIACGTLTLTENQDDSGTTTGETNGGTTAGTTTGTTTGDATTTGGDFGTITGGDFGTTTGGVGGDISGSIGGDTAGVEF